MKEQEGDFFVLNNIRKNELLDIFCTLVQIPSPSKKEEKVIAWIKEFATQNNINCESDTYGNLYLNIPATDDSKQQQEP
jgi:dipeptidase D